MICKGAWCRGGAELAQSYYFHSLAHNISAGLPDADTNRLFSIQAEIAASRYLAMRDNLATAALENKACTAFTDHERSGIRIRRCDLGHD